MPLKVKHFFTKRRFLLLGILLLLFPALLIHLGLIAFYDDEGIRSLVALEMQLSGNYLTPTMFGEYYYNKPPLYNWLLIAIFEITGRNDEFIARLLTIICLMAYAFTVYRIFRRELSKDAPGNMPGRMAEAIALMGALSLITCGRILFWDSMLALIDTCFSWVMFILLMVVYRAGEKEQYGRLFGWSYFLAAIGFMLKGLPAIVFLGIGLLTYLLWQKKWRQLFSMPHAAGILIFSLIVGGYYAAYAGHNGLEEVFTTLFDESAKRTFVKYGLGDTLLHLLTFPFEMWYHFLPWTLFAIYLFRKNSVSLLKQNKFICWNLLVFLTTLLPYWSSVEVYPRYLFAHVPLLFIALFYLHYKHREAGTGMFKATEFIFFVLCLLVTVASLAVPFWDKVADVPLLMVKASSISLSFALLCWLYWRMRSDRLLVFVMVMLVARTGYNWFILPTRADIECSTEVRKTTLEAAEIVGDRPLYIYKNSLGFQPATGYYFTRETERILREQHEEPEPEAFYLIHPGLYDSRIMQEVMRVRIKWECGQLVLGYNK